MHGQLGDLPWYPVSEPNYCRRNYHSGCGVDETKACARHIRVVGDFELDSDSYFEDARETLRQADVVCFVGFGYHPDSLHRLGFPDVARDRQVYGTAYKVPLGRRLEIANAIPGISLGERDEGIVEFFDRLGVLRQFKDAGD
jgi:hypothetical protein